jgi:elongation factor Ts
MMTTVSAKDVKELRDRTDAPMMDCRNALVEAKGDVEAAIKILKEKGKTKAAKRAGRETTQGAVAIQVNEGNHGAAAVMVCCETDFAAKNEHFQNVVKTALDCALKLPAGSCDLEALLSTHLAGAGTLNDLVTAAIATVGENVVVKSCARLGGTVNGYVHFDKKSCALVQADIGNLEKASSPEAGALLRDIAMHVVAFSPIPLAIERTAVPAAAVAAEKEIFLTRAKESGKPAAILEKIVSGQVDKFLAERALLEQSFVKNPDVTIGQLVQNAAKSLGTTIKVVRFERFQIGV